MNLSLKPWLWGSDVNRYQVKWNGQEYIDYCDGIANPRDPKYFRGKRILIREITNPSIFAVLTEEELYNDPSIIIIRDNASHSLKSLLGILNSKLATFYHFNNSPKATKGAFPKILVKDIKEFPLPPTYSSISLENIVDYILWLYKFGESTRIMNYFANSHLVQFFEEILNAIVYEVYFEQELQKYY
ncbi:MAG: hypothetical protein IPJ75_09710 [Ignavibacteriales bacterium]|nr:hypothetical protein [Ignavibacteriales bacterium]